MCFVLIMSLYPVIFNFQKFYVPHKLVHLLLNIQKDKLVYGYDSHEVFKMNFEIHGPTSGVGRIHTQIKRKGAHISREVRILYS